MKGPKSLPNSSSRGRSLAGLIGEASSQFFLFLFLFLFLRTASSPLLLLLFSFPSPSPSPAPRPPAWLPYQLTLYNICPLLLSSLFPHLSLSLILLLLFLLLRFPIYLPLPVSPGTLIRPQKPPDLPNLSDACRLLSGISHSVPLLLLSLSLLLFLSEHSP